ncbi:MAG: putative glycoside hydrolase [Clostridia bacterium]|nr:putative glycoside hydrolase [Clostridia bacterium]
MKKRGIVVSALVIIGVLVGGVAFQNYQAKERVRVAELERVERSEAFKVSYHDVHHAMQARVMPLLYQVEREVKEAKRLELEAFLVEHGKFVRTNNLVIYEALGGEKLDTTYSRATSVIVFDEAEWEGEPYGHVGVDYEAGPEGWVAMSSLTDQRTDLMERSYENVDYNPQIKTNGYASNPRVDVRGIYVTGYKAGGSIDDLIALSKRTEINTFVIDVKDDNGNMLFYSETADKYVPSANKKPYISDPVAFIQKLHDNDIYVIARIVTFKSPRYSKQYPERSIVYKGTGTLFRSRDGISWASPYDRDLWDYNIGVALEAANYGFNEIQFDYVRFPDTGSKKDQTLDFRNTLGENKTEAIQGFLKYAYEKLSAEEVYVAADVFGWTATALGDVGIGQHWEAMTNVVDYMCPMVYPSHYGPGNFGLSVPDAYPYETIDRAMKDAIKRNNNIETPARLRPWIQDFTAPWVKGYIPYGPREVSLQIKALKDNGISEYILWNPLNRYSESALQ